MVTRDEYVAGLHEVFDPIGQQINGMAAIVSHTEIITVFDSGMSAIGMALNGPTGVVGLNDETELNCVKAVLDDDTVANTMEMQVYNGVLARGAAALRGAV